MNKAGLIYGPEFHHLDHLAPLCAQMGIPLILTDEQIADQAGTFYPDLKVLLWDPLEAPQRLVSQFDTVYYSTPRVLFDQVFFFAQAIHNKRIKTIWCPHGNSDKGRSSPFMEALIHEEQLLTYGPRIEAFLKEKGINVPMHRVGNYRLAYYQKHKEFYQKLLPPKTKPTILYAPTWQDLEKNSSFPSFWPYLRQAPAEFRLIVKLHPNLHQQYPEEISQLEILENFPPIYPILDQADIYIGDLSSIGYDFLAFNRPMILLKESELCKAGVYVPPEKYDQVFELCGKLLGSSAATTDLYRETFSN
ncbi:MAG: CDP-glycerol glycerophosphotransferase family protein [Verrucomicrobia bacterium]|nr:CDP-glycerol glycerophosphotransferase family protein [Verrucomicrobiota bacterium]